MSRITGAPACSSSSRLAAPVSTPATSPAPARRPGLDVAGRVPGDREFADRSPAQPQQRGERHVGPGPPAARVRGREREVDQRPPAQRVEQRVPGRRGEPGGQADLDPGRAQRRERLLGPRQRRDLAGPDRPGVMLLEGLVGPLRGVLPAARMCRNTSILDWPMVCAHVGQRVGVLGRAGSSPNCSTAALNAAITLPSSATVVPAMSRQATVISRLVAGRGGLGRSAVMRMSPRRWRARRSCPGPRAR